MVRVRSPNYPQLSLSEAIARVEKVLAAESMHPAPKEVIIKHLGYSSVNGASLGVLSALMKYGLLERHGPDYRVSDLALLILHPTSPEEKAAAIRKAATEPSLFSEMMENFKGVLPSDDNLRAYLIRRGFAQSAVSGVINALRDTMELVASEPKQYTAEPPVTAKQKPRMYAEHTANPPAPSQEIVRKLLVQFDGDGLQVTAGLVDQADVERLIEILSANKTLLPPSRVKPDVAVASDSITLSEEDHIDT